MGRPAAAQVYRETVPHYPLPAGPGNAPIYQSWQIGRVLFIASDVRWARDPNASFGSRDKTMLGVEQKRWMERVLSTSDASALVWILPSIWLSDQGNTRTAGIGYSGADYSSDSYWRFRHERAELTELFGDTGWARRMICLQADKHALSMSTGPNNPWGGFPLFMFASMDSGYSTEPEGQYDLGQSPGRQRYGTVRVVDSGHTIALQGTGYVMDQVWRSHTAYAHVEPHVVRVNYAAGETFEPLRPTDDDQGLVNDYTASRTQGEEYHHELSEGPLGVEDPPHGVGRYSGSGTFNVPSDAELPDQAGWRVHKGTVDAARFPSVGFLLHNPRMNHLREGLAGLDTGDRLEITNPPPWLPPETIGVITQGYEERLNTHEWEITYNATPAEQVEVAQVAPNQILNTNHSFEVNTVGGWEGAGAAVTHDHTHSYLGTYSARVTPTGAPEAQLVSRAADSPRVYAGTEYTFSCWVRPDTARPVQMLVQWLDDDGSPLGSPPLVPEQTPPVGEWTNLVGTAVAPEGAVALRWIIEQRPGGGPPLTAADVFWVDQATITDGASPGPNQPNRVDTSGAELVVPVGEGDTDLWVHTRQTPVSGARWITSSGPGVTHAHEFPFDVAVGGETMRVTSCEPGGYDLFRTPRPAGSWGTTEQGLTWTGVNLANTGVGVDPVNQYAYMRLASNPTQVRRQILGLYGPLTDCEVLWSVRTNQLSQGGPGNAQLPSLLLRYQDGFTYYRCRVHLLIDGTVGLSITRDVTTIGDEVRLPHLTYTPGAAFENRVLCRVRIIGNRILARAWKPTRSMAGIDGTGLDIGYQEPNTWHIDRTITENTVEAGMVGFTASTFGGYTGVGPEMRFQLLEIVTPQRFTVQRSVNGVTKSHPAGEGVRLAHPAIIGL